jgi:hypothetical protein
MDDDNAQVPLFVCVCVVCLCVCFVCVFGDVCVCLYVCMVCVCEKCDLWRRVCTCSVALWWWASTVAMCVEGGSV